MKANKAAKFAMLGVGTGLLVVGTSENASAAFDVEIINWAIGELCGHIMGHLGGLLTTVAATGALIAAAMGSYRVFYGAIITAVGAFAVSTILSLHFPKAAAECKAPAGGGAVAPAGGGGGGTETGGGGGGGGEDAPPPPDVDETDEP